LAVAQHLPQGRHQAGDRHLNFHDTRDNLKKYRDILKNPKVAFVVDDLASVNPWRPRGVEVRGVAEVLDRGGSEMGRGFDPEMFRITPRRVVSWGLHEQMSFKERTVPQPTTSSPGQE
jgi:hypothetical protein